MQCKVLQMGLAKIDPHLLSTNYKLNFYRPAKTPFLLDRYYLDTTVMYVRMYRKNRINNFCFFSYFFGQKSSFFFTLLLFGPSNEEVCEAESSCTLLLCSCAVVVVQLLLCSCCCCAVVVVQLLLLCSCCCCAVVVVVGLLWFFSPLVVGILLGCLVAWWFCRATRSAPLTFANCPRPAIVL